MSDIITSDAPTRRAGTEGTSLRNAAVIGFLGTLLVVTTAPVRSQAAPTWRLTLPFVAHPGGRLFSVTTFLLGMALLGYGWYRLGNYAARRDLSPNRRLRMVGLVITLWALPIVLGPPLLSNDVYSYAAQGELASHGYDTTKWGPIALGGGPFLRAADEIWHHNPSPYGPVWNKLAAGVVTTTGHDPAAAVWGFRVVIALSVVVAGWALALLAKDLGADPALAVALGIGNPLTLIHILGGIHNDGLMMALLLVGVYLARRKRRWAALVLITAAAAVKLPAAAGLVFLGWNWRDELDTRLKRFAGAAVAGAIGMLLIVWLSIEVRMGMGWLGALRGTSKVMSTFAPVTMTGLVFTEVLGFFGIHVSSGPIVNLFRAGGLLLAAWLAWLLLSNCRRIGTELALGLTLVIAVVLGPVMWPWYLPPAILVVVAAGAERFRPAFTVACIGASFFVLPTSAQASLGSNGMHSLFRMGLFLVIAAAAMLAQWLAREQVLPTPMLDWLRRRRPEREALATA
jgi:Glycosyltransferase family 87